MESEVLFDIRRRMRDIEREEEETKERMRQARKEAGFSVLQMLYSSKKKKQVEAKEAAAALSPGGVYADRSSASRHLPFASQPAQDVPSTALRSLSQSKEASGSVKESPPPPRRAHSPIDIKPPSPGQLPPPSKLFSPSMSFQQSQQSPKRPRPTVPARAGSPAYSLPPSSGTSPYEAFSPRQERVSRAQVTEQYTSKEEGEVDTPQRESPRRDKLSAIQKERMERLREIRLRKQAEAEARKAEAARRREEERRKKEEEMLEEWRLAHGDPTMPAAVAAEVHRNPVPKLKPRPSDTRSESSHTSGSSYRRGKGTARRRGPTPRGLSSAKAGNKVRVRNALEKIVLAGKHMAEARQEALAMLERDPNDSFVILLSSPQTRGYKGLFSYNHSLKQSMKIHGDGPVTLHGREIACSFKYNTASRSLGKVHTRELGLSVDAVCLARRP